MTTREYELTIITNAHLGEDEQKQLLDKYESTFLAEGGELVQKSYWGAKKLMFAINKQFRGKYYHYDFVGNAKNLHEAERLMRIDDRVLRYLTVKIGEDVDVEARKLELAKAAAILAAQSKQPKL